jgi:hypothetical protein
MKKIIILLLSFCLIIYAAKAQSDSTYLMHKAGIKSLFLKSKKQKSIAWILLGSGLGIAAIGGIVQLNHEYSRAGGFNFDFTGAGIAVGGGIIALSGIPLFISSSNNKKKAELFIKNQTLNISPQIQTNKQLAIGLKIKL